jgi:hypothetical protein
MGSAVLLRNARARKLEGEDGGGREGGRAEDGVAGHVGRLEVEDYGDGEEVSTR